MWRSFYQTILWVICGTILWHILHSITLIFPLPGPWLPTQAAWATGILMGCLGRFLSSELFAGIVWQSRGLFCLLGSVSGAYLGWIFARGILTQRGDFLTPSENEQLLSAVVCGALGLAANCVMSWLMDMWGDRPFRVLCFLLFLLLLIFAAVSFLIILHKVYR